MTIGFSHKGNYWTSRYSFEPDAYGMIDNQLLSFKDIFIEGSEVPAVYMGDVNISSGHRLCWRHRHAFVNNQGSFSYNNFFNEQRNSLIEFVCNENPSMEKFFKSISIESNQNLFESTIRTNVEAIDQAGYKLQTSYAKNFVNKEEALYSDYRYSLNNSTSHYNYCGYVIPDAELITSLIVPITNPQGLESQVISNVYKVGKFFSFNSSNSIPRVNGIITQDMEDEDIINMFSYRVSCAIALQSNNQSNFISLAVNGSASTYPFSGPSFNDSSILYRHYKYFIGSDDNLYLITNSTFNIGQVNDMSKIGVMKVCHPEFYGDQMRGKYAIITVSQLGSYGTIPFEIYGFNIQYEQSHLDSE